MAVFVDDMRAQFRRMIMCHLIADSHEELISMARAIGVATKWIQHAGTPEEHFDISLTKRALAIQHGAISITWRQCAAMTKRKQVEGKLGSPRSALTWLTNYYRERDRRDKRNEKDGDMRKPRRNNKPNIDERAHVGQLVTILIGGSRVFAGEVVEIDTETGQILAAYITGGRMLRFKPGKPPTSKLLRDWNDKQTFFSLCPHDGWESFVQARDVLQPLYREWKDKQETKVEAKTQKQATSTGLTDEQRRAWLAKNSIPRPTKATK